jgi:phage-related protein
MSCASSTPTLRGASSTAPIRTRIVIAEVFRKTTRATPKQVIENCRRRLREYDDA